MLTASQWVRLVWVTGCRRESGLQNCDMFEEVGTTCWQSRVEYCTGT